MAMKHIKTKTGFEIDIDENVIDDMELFDAVVDLQSGNMLAVPKVVSKIFGDNKARLYDHCRQESGRVPTQAINDEITAVFEALNAKNS